jgi:peptide/nickel transport system permease protein
VTRRDVLRRLGQVPLAVAGILVLAFLVLHLAPGDPVVAVAGEHGDAAYYAFMRARFGLDRPLPVQLLTYLGRLLHGDLGVSFVQGRPVLQVVAERLPAMLLLMTTALVMSSGTGVLLGIWAARAAHRLADLVLRTAAVLGAATPAFWLAQVAVLTLALGTGLFPVQGMTDARRGWTGVPHLLDVLHHLALPAGVLAATEVALPMRLVRTGLLDVLGTDYIRTARAKGLPEPRVLYHALRNALLPLVTVIGSRIGMVFAGATLVEVIFAWPGLGQLLLAAVQTRDYPVLLGIVLLVSVTVILANLLTDLVSLWLDPRLRDA